MMMIFTSCSQHIRQKSPTVSFNGPCAAMNDLLLEYDCDMDLFDLIGKCSLL